jgi:hypothetical protein
MQRRDDEALTVVAPSTASMISQGPEHTFAVKIYNTTEEKLYYEIKLLSDDCSIHPLTPTVHSIEPFRSDKVKVLLIYGVPRRAELVDAPERVFQLRMELPTWKYRQVGDYRRRVDLEATVEWIALKAKAKDGSDRRIQCLFWI